MSAIEKLRRKKEQLGIELGVLGEKKKRLFPLLKRHRCKTPADIKRAATVIKEELDKLDSVIHDLTDEADSLIESMEEKIDE